MKTRAIGKADNKSGCHISTDALDTSWYGRDDNETDVMSASFSAAGNGMRSMGKRVTFDVFHWKAMKVESKKNIRTQTLQTDWLKMMLTTDYLDQIQFDTKAKLKIQ